MTESESVNELESSFALVEESLGMSEANFSKKFIFQKLRESIISSSQKSNEELTSLLDTSHSNLFLELGSTLQADIDGFSSEEQIKFHFYGASIISDACRFLVLPVQTCISAQTIFHRFYTRCSFLKYDLRDVAMGSVFLAGKAQETIKRPRDLAYVFFQIFKIEEGIQQRPVELIDDKSYQFSQLRMIVQKMEREILKELGFELFQITWNEQPHRLMYFYIKLFSPAKSGNQESSFQNLTRLAFNYLNDSYKTNLCVYLPFQMILASSIYLAFRSLKMEMPKIPWWAIMETSSKYLKLGAGKIQSLYNQIKKIPKYTDCYLIFLKVGSSQNKVLPFNLEYHEIPSPSKKPPEFFSKSKNKYGSNHQDKDYEQVPAQATEKLREKNHQKERGKDSHQENKKEKKSRSDSRKKQSKKSRSRDRKKDKHSSKNKKHSLSKDRKKKESRSRSHEKKKKSRDNKREKEEANLSKKRDVDQSETSSKLNSHSKRSQEVSIKESKKKSKSRSRSRHKKSKKYSQKRDDEKKRRSLSQKRGDDKKRRSVSKKKDYEKKRHSSSKGKKSKHSSSKDPKRQKSQEKQSKKQDKTSPVLNKGQEKHSSSSNNNNGSKINGEPTSNSNLKMIVPSQSLAVEANSHIPIQQKEQTTEEILLKIKDSFINANLKFGSQQKNVEKDQADQNDQLPKQSSSSTSSVLVDEQKKNQLLLEIKKTIQGKKTEVSDISNDQPLQSEESKIIPELELHKIKNISSMPREQNSLHQAHPKPELDIKRIRNPDKVLQNVDSSNKKIPQLNILQKPLELPAKSESEGNGGIKKFDLATVKKMIQEKNKSGNVAVVQQSESQKSEKITEEQDKQDDEEYFLQLKMKRAQMKQRNQQL